MPAAQTNRTTILGIAGSLRTSSYNRRLLHAAAELAPGARLVVWDGLKSVAPFDEDDEPAPPRAVLELRAAIAGADAVLLATPEYNHSIPGSSRTLSTGPRARAGSPSSPASRWP